MKVILKEDIKGVGKKDQIINANDGYARNYLFPKNLAVQADKGNLTNLQYTKTSSKSRRKWKSIWKYYLKRNCGKFRKAIWN